MDVGPMEPEILCCECGTPVAANPTSMCASCLRSKVDITEGISRQVAQNHCRGCNRYERQGGWVACEPESKELLAVLLKRVRGLDKVRLVDASFVWTEAHSKRLKVKVTVQKEVARGAVLQQALVVEFVVANRQCDKCARVEAQDYWVSAVQLRQKVPHKRTVLWLEQLILRHGAHADCVSISELRDGLDFYHAERNHSEKLATFLQTVAPARCKTARQMITHDTHTGVHRSRHTFSVEVVPVCRDDLVALPGATAARLGGLGPLVLCYKVASHLHFLDVGTLARGELSGSAFFQRPFASLCTREHLRDFVVLDVEPLSRAPGHAPGGAGGAGGAGTKWALAEVTVARESDLGKNDTRFTVRSHLGAVLKAGDRVRGYDLGARTLDLDEWPSLAAHKGGLPEVVLVRKAFSHAHRRRLWRLKTLRKEAADAQAMDVEGARRDRELFLRDLEEDRELRQKVNLYKDPEALARASAAAQGHPVARGARYSGAAPVAPAGGACEGAGGPDEGSRAEAEEEELSEAEVGVEELLDDLTLGDNEAFDEDPADGAGPRKPPGGVFSMPGGPDAKFHF